MKIGSDGIVKNNKVDIIEHDYRLDIIRCIAMFFIVTAHFAYSFQMTDSILYGYKNGGWGSVGTAIFFILSGYCLQIKKWNFSSKKEQFLFYKKRFFSIYPLLWLTFILGYVTNSLILGDFKYGGNPLLIILSFLGIDGYATYFGVKGYYVIGEWFTAIIIFVYLLYPLIHYLFSRFRIGTTIILGVCYFLNVFVCKTLPPDISIFTGLFLFWIGMLIHEYKDILSGRKTLLIITSLLISVIVIFVPLPYWNSSLPWKNLLALCIFMLIYLLSSNMKYRNRKANDFLKFEGKLCYAVYLCHHALIYWVPMFLSKNGIDITSKILLYIIILIVIEVVASILFFISHRCTSWGRKKQ